MAASAWTVPVRTRRLLGEGEIDLKSAGVFQLVFIRSGATLPSETLSAETMGSWVTDGITKHASIANYSASGTVLAGVSWKISGSNCVFDCTDFSVSMNGAALSDLRAAVILQSAGDRIICYASLSSASFDVLDGNKLTITMASGGIFTLAG